VLLLILYSGPVPAGGFECLLRSTHWCTCSSLLYLQTHCLWCKYGGVCNVGTSRYVGITAIWKSVVCTKDEDVEFHHSKYLLGACKGCCADFFKLASLAKPSFGSSFSTRMSTLPRMEGRRNALRRSSVQFLYLNPSTSSDLHFNVSSCTISCLGGRLGKQRF
jgi:hypothetical protein